MKSVLRCEKRTFPVKEAFRIANIIDLIFYIHTVGRKIKTYLIQFLNYPRKFNN